MILAKSEKKDLTDQSALHVVPNLKQILLLVIIVSLFAGLLALWHWFDHALPAPDDSSYILGSFRYAELLRHPKFWQLDWWHNMLTVNRIYPPTVMVFNGILRLLFGYGQWMNVLSVIIFNALLTATVYGTSFLLTGSWRTAILAALIINLYPQTNAMSHGFALDAPLMSMVSVGIFMLLWWRKAPSWPRAFICGLTLGLVCLTKQIAVAYLIGPGLFCLAESIAIDIQAHQRYNRSIQLLCAAMLTLTIGLPWLLTNLPALHTFAQYNESSMGQLPLWQVFNQDILFYVNSLPSIISPLLFATFAISFFICDKNTHRLLLPISLSAIGGIVLVSTLTWSFPSIRYGAPAMVASAIYSGYVMDKMMNKRRLAVVVGAILVLAAVQYISFNFAPYPLAQPAFATDLSEKLGVKLVETFGLTKRDRRETIILHSNPQPLQDWGQQWALDMIDRVAGKKAVYLNILPDYVQLNGNTFELLARIMNSPVRPTTSRKWTVMGDEVSFDPQVAMYYQWYLLKSGYQGNILRNDQSEKNYAKLIAFVQHSGKFNQIASHKLPDGTTMFLYQQR